MIVTMSKYVWPEAILPSLKQSTSQNLTSMCRPVGGICPAGPDRSPLCVPRPTNSTHTQSPLEITLLISTLLSGKAVAQFSRYCRNPPGPCSVSPVGTFVHTRSPAHRLMG